MREMHPNDADRKQIVKTLSSLIWVCTVFLGMSVQNLRISSIWYQCFGQTGSESKIKQQSGPSCLKLTTSLVNVLLKF